MLLAGAEAARRVAAGRSGPAQGDAGSAGSGTQEQRYVRDYIQVVLGMLSDSTLMEPILSPVSGLVKQPGER